MFIKYELKHSKRKSLSITVKADNRVVVSAPRLMPKMFIEAFVQKKKPWIEKKLAYFKSLPQVDENERFKIGSLHYFLGQEYPLKILNGKNKVRLVDGVFYVSCQNPLMVEKLLDKWYKRQAESLFANRLQHCYLLMSELELQFPPLKIRKMKRRWGSCSNKGNITLNLNLIKTPLPCIDYVIIHELCHLKVFNHSKDFYNLQSRFVPDWKEKKQILNRFQLV